METFKSAEAYTSAYHQALECARAEMAIDPDLVLRELRREITQRGKVYPRLLLKGTLSADDAAKQTVLLEHAIVMIEAYRSPSLFA